MRWKEYLSEGKLPVDSDGDIDWKKVKKGTNLVLMKGWGFYWGTRQQSFNRAKKDMPVTFERFLDYSGKGIQVNCKEHGVISVSPQSLKGK